MSGTHQIIQVKGHYEAYDEYGNFVSSGDTYEECYNDLIDIIVVKTREKIYRENIREVVAIWVIIGKDIVNHIDIKAS